MFFVAEALLAARGRSLSSHKAVLSGYGQLFAKNKELDPRFHKALLTAFSQRQLGDYSPESGLDQEDIDEMFTDAVQFLDAADVWLARQSGPDG
jgi:uncharacterized protein (UPF0332 family)